MTIRGAGTGGQNVPFFKKQKKKKEGEKKKRKKKYCFSIGLISQGTIHISADAPEGGGSSPRCHKGVIRGSGQSVS